MIDRNQVLEIVKYQGPVLPRHVMKKLGGDTFIIGAVLSQLKDSKLLKVSHTKIGGSPVYYTSEQEPKLQELYKYLHDKEKKAFDMLKQSKLLQDSKLEPVIRVALRNIKDFAKPIVVNMGEQKEIFWKWFLLSNNEAESGIRELLKTTIKSEAPKQEEQPKKEELVPTEIAKQKVTEKKPRAEKPKAAPLADFLKQIRNYFANADIEVVEETQMKKNSEFDFIIKLPSAAGKLTYYCKAKRKKRYNEGDLSTAYVMGETKKLPILFLITGKLTKRAEEMLSNEFKNISVVSLN